ncbi:MAG: glycosyltransferase 87 family protein [Caldilineaceae bacterium]
MLAVLGVGAAAVFGFGLALRYPLAAGIRLPRHTWAQVTGGATVPGLLLHIAVYTAAVLLYMTALHLVLRRTAEQGSERRREHIIAVVIGGWLLASLVLMSVAPGGESHDVFDYLFRGRMLVEAGGSPLADVPAHFVELPYYQYLTWTDHVDTYGPLWEYASGATAAAARGSLMALGRWDAGTPQCPAGAQSCLVLTGYVVAYRLLAVTLAGLCGWLIYRLVRGIDARLAAAAMLAWLWNPLLLVASAVGAHNDMLMLVLLLASFWALQRRRWLAALLLLVLATHVKLTALTLAPVYGFWLVRHLGWRRALAYAAVTLGVGLALSWLLYAPLGGWATLPRMLEERQRYVALSFHHLLYRFLLARGVESEVIWHLTIQWPTLLYVACSVALAWLLVGRRKAAREQGSAENARSFWRAATAANLFYLLVGSFWFQTWYVLWVLAPAALLPASRFTRYVLPWLCWGVLCSNVVADYLPQLAQPPFTRTGRLSLAVMLVWAPAAVAALVVVLWQQWRKMRA